MTLFKRLIPALAAMLLGGCSSGYLSVNPPSGQHPFPTVNQSSGVHNHPVHGIDVSKYQGNIDWNQVRASGVSFAWIKATEGADHRDAMFMTNWVNAKAAGVPRGAYHFAFWCSPVWQQIQNFKATVPHDPDALPPVLDVEWNHQSRTCPHKVTREYAITYMRQFLNAMEAHYGKRPVIYADIPFHRDILADGALHEYPFWIRAVKHLPHERYPGRKWAFWQFTAKGRVAGIPTEVDRNVFGGSQQQWQTLMASNFRTLDHGTTPVRAHSPAPAAAPEKPKIMDEPLQDPMIAKATPQGEDEMADTPLGQPIGQGAKPIAAAFVAGPAVPTKPVAPLTPLAANPVPLRPTITAPTPVSKPGQPTALAAAADVLKRRKQTEFDPTMPMPPAAAAELRAAPMPLTRQ